MPSSPPPVLPVTHTLSLPPKSLGNTAAGTLQSVALTPDQSSLFALSSTGVVTALWLKTGALKEAFGDKGVLDTKTKHSAAMLLYADQFGSGRLLTAGGFDVQTSSSPSSQLGGPSSVVQGVVKHFDLSSGKVLQTYMGGSGVVRCLGVPGRAVANARQTGSDKSEEAERRREDKEKRRKERRRKERGAKAGGADYDDDEDDDFRPNASPDSDSDDPDAAAGGASASSEATRGLSNSSTLRNFCAGGDDSLLRFYDVRSAKVVASFGDGGAEGGGGAAVIGQGKCGRAGAMLCIATCEEKEFLVACGHRAAFGGEGGGDLGRTFTTPRKGDGRTGGTPAKGQSSSSSSSDHGVVRLWDVRMRELSLTLPEPHLHETTAISLSPDGFTIFTAGGGEGGPTVKEWDLRMGARPVQASTPTPTPTPTTRGGEAKQAGADDGRQGGGGSEHSLIADNSINAVVAASPSPAPAPAPSPTVVPSLNLTPGKGSAGKLPPPLTVAVHPSQITSLASLVTPHGSRNYVLSTSKSGLAYLHSTSRTGVVKSQAVLTLENYSRENTYDPNKEAFGSPGDISALETLGKGWAIDADFRLLMKEGKLSKLDLRITGSDRKVRTYDVAEAIGSKVNPKAAAESAEALAPVASLNLSESKRDSKEDNYHRKQMEFWDNLPSEPAEAKTTNNRNNTTKPGAVVADKEKDLSLDPYGNPTHDEFGNKFGSIEYWVMKGEKPKRLKVGELVVLAGENVTASGAAGDGGSGLTSTAKLNLPPDALNGSLRPYRYDIGVVTADDQSGMPYEVFGAISATKSWFEEAWIVLATEETISRIQALGGIEIERVKAQERQRSGVLKKSSTPDASLKKVGVANDEGEDEEDVAYYKQMMLTGGGGHGGWAGAGEDTAQAKSTAKATTAPDAKAAAVKKSLGREDEGKRKVAGEEDDEEDFRPQSASGNPLPAPPVLTAEAKKAEEERQKLVQDSLDMYRKQKAAAAAAKGKKF